jgi:hypothetical protein
MIIRPSVDPQLCFVLMPFTKTFNQYYKTILKPTVESEGFKCVRADEIYGEAIMTDIWNSIWRAAVVIADVTRKNPNVNYELGICHALGVPTVIIAQSLKYVPFDYRHRRHTLYHPGATGWRKRLKCALSNLIKAALDDSSRDRLLVWPDGAKMVHRAAKTSLHRARSVLLDFPRVPFKHGQNADFISREIPRGSRGFKLKITVPGESYWRCGFVLAPEDYIREGRADVAITQYFLFHIYQGDPANPKQPTPLFYTVWHQGQRGGTASFQSESPVELAVRFAPDRRGLTADFGDAHYETDLDPTYFRYLYVLAWADPFGHFRVPVELRLR